MLLVFSDYIYVEWDNFVVIAIFFLECIAKDSSGKSLEYCHFDTVTSTTFARHILTLRHLHLHTDTSTTV